MPETHWTGSALLALWSERVFLMLFCQVTVAKDPPTSAKLIFYVFMNYPPLHVGASSSGDA